MFYLRKPKIEDKEEYLKYIEEWKDEKIVPYSSRLLEKDFLTWMKDLLLWEKEESKPENYVPATTFLFMQDDRIIGAVNIRHYLNDHLLSVGGHIGYGIRPSERRKGYAKIMCSLALEEARKLGIDMALITADEDNVPSNSTILSCGGVLESKVFDNEHFVCRYWVETTETR